MTSRYGPYELVDNVDYGSHEQALTWLGEQYAGPLNVATGYVGLEGLDTLARIAGERGGVTRLLIGAAPSSESLLGPPDCTVLRTRPFRATSAASAPPIGESSGVGME